MTIKKAFIFITINMLVVCFGCVRMEAPRLERHTEGVIIDKETGLEWVSGGQTFGYDGAKAWVEGCKIQGGGWRMPTREELLSVYDNREVSSKLIILPKYLRIDHVWAEPRDALSAWYFDMGIGASNWYFKTTSKNRQFYVLGVRKFMKNTPKIGKRELVEKGSPRFLVSKEGIISDKNTGLEWFEGPNWTFDFETAIKWMIGCSDFAGGGWQIPTAMELKTLFVKSLPHDSLDPVFKLKFHDRWAADSHIFDIRSVNEYKVSSKDSSALLLVRLPPSQGPAKAKQYQVDSEINPAPAISTGNPIRKIGDLYIDPTTRMEFIYAPGGCFKMGDAFGGGGASEKPVHETCVNEFYIGKYEVTQGEYETLTGTNPSLSNKGSRYPVTGVSWNDTQLFINTLNNKSGKLFRLPTEAEWEYAARSGGKSEKYSGSNNVDDVAWYSNNSGNTIHLVGTKSANGLGLHDMSGNVWEWCNDWYGESFYESSPRQNPAGPSVGTHRVIRGGGLQNDWGVRSTRRNYESPDSRHSHNLGFRLLLQVGAPGS